jgi:hypothetical protein
MAHSYCKIGMLSKYVISSTLLMAMAATAQPDGNSPFSPEEQEMATTSLSQAQNAATHMTIAEIRQVFKIERPVCSDARDVGLSYIDKVSDHLDLSLWQGILLTHLCIVKWYGSSEQQAALIALMGKGTKK